MEMGSTVIQNKLNEGGAQQIFFEIFILYVPRIINETSSLIIYILNCIVMYCNVY